MPNFALSKDDSMMLIGIKEEDIRNTCIKNNTKFVLAWNEL